MALCLIFPACSEDKIVGNKSSVEWPDRTDKDDCIEIILLAYEHKNIEKYKEVLLEPDNDAAEFPEGYYWYTQEEDVNPIGISFDYNLDWEATLGIFNNAVSIYLSIYSGAWQEILIFREQPCEDCWQSMREYAYIIEFDDGDNYIGNYRIDIFVGPDRDDPDKYKIYQANDTPISAVSHSVSANSIIRSDPEDAMWGVLKNMYLERN